ncbi:hypothetical protein GXW78_23475 [Roseomonas terrae]|uniref:DUF883 domain-containing protein n=1 Tax=Neoroseomonas terrae TaxID=424799 RepID=A0ABS5ENL9_9PROT|nr:hypothetical protein [Neoroseomonas terrae]MBR0652638.1 hypothetical protein [Neoroseomonas terrae]
MSSARSAAEDAKDAVKDTVQHEIAALRAKVEALMADRVTPAIAGVAGQAEELATSAAAMARRQSDSLASTVRAQPFAAIATAAVAGLAIGLLMRR